MPKRKRRKRTSTVAAAKKALDTNIQFTTWAIEFSKILSIVFISIYGLTWFASVVCYILTVSLPYELLDFVLQPTLVVCGSYFATKCIENVSKGLCAWLNKQLELQMSKEANEIIRLDVDNSTGDEDQSDT